MNESSTERGLSFKTKVLVPVVIIMVLLVAVLLCIVNLRMTRQFQSETAQRLNTADAIFVNSQRIRTRNLLLRYSNIPNEPKFKAVCQLGEPKTMRFLLNELTKEFDTAQTKFT